MTTLHINVIVDRDGTRRALSHHYQSATHAAIAALSIPLQRGERIEPEPAAPGRSVKYVVRSHIRELSTRAQRAGLR